MTHSFARPGVSLALAFVLLASPLSPAQEPEIPTSKPQGPSLGQAAPQPDR